MLLHQAQRLIKFIYKINNLILKHFKKSLITHNFSHLHENDPTSKKSADNILKEQIHVRKKRHDSQYFQYLNFCLCYRTTFRPIVSSWESPYGHPTTGPLMIWKLDNPTSRTSPCLVNCLEMRSSIN